MVATSKFNAKLKSFPLQIMPKITQKTVLINTPAIDKIILM
jgi:hypothetical protein